MKRMDLLVVLGLCLGAAVYYVGRSHLGTAKSGPWSAGSLPKEILELKVRPPMVFSGKTKAEILKLREEQMALEPKLRGLLPSKVPPPEPAPENASEAGPSPHQGILSAVNDGSPWRSLVGELWSVNDEDGESTASISVLNPFLLCGVRYAVRNSSALPGVSAVDAARLTFQEAVRGDLLPTQMTFDGPNRRLLVNYRLRAASPLLQLKSQLGADHILIYLENCNAGELGLPYFAVNSKGTSGVRYVQGENAKAKNALLGFDKIMPCNQQYATIKNRNELYIKTGGYMTMSIQNFPVKIELNYWRGWQKQFSEECDFHQTITIQPVN